jgi:hypothetical protein
MVDLRTCKPGDKLLTKHGTVLTYVRPLPENDYYDHVIEYPNGAGGTRMHDGHVFRHDRREEDEDIVEILGDG